MTTWDPVILHETDPGGLAPDIEDPFDYKPWGNFGFFDNTDGNTASHDLTRIGETEDIDQIELLDGQQITTAVATDRKRNHG
jgi:hypothetical protein